LLSKQLFDATFSRPENQLALASVNGGPSDFAERALAQTPAPFPDAKLRTRSQFISDQESAVQTLLTLLYVLLALSVIVSLFGMVNTLVIAALAGIGAAVLPARRAARLNVLEALHYE
jgi:putative ABC transport system permease protein